MIYKRLQNICKVGYDEGRRNQATAKGFEVGRKKMNMKLERKLLVACVGSKCLGSMSQGSDFER